jgi:hypothetical protein
MAVALVSSAVGAGARAGQESPAVIEAEGAQAQGADEAGAESPATRETRGFLRRLDLDIRGRVLARAWRRSAAGSGSNDLDFQNVRLELRWTPSRRLRGVFEWDFAEARSLKDAWLRLRLGAWAVRAGQFKPPGSALELLSRWDLPTSERGLLRDVLIDSMGVAGRRPGVELAFASKGRWDLDVRVGTFLSSHVRGDRIGDEAFDNLVDDFSPRAQKLAGRVALTRKRFEIGAFGEWRPAKPMPEGSYRRYWTTGLDLSWSDRPAKGGRRVWAETYIGSSWQDWSAFDGLDATFLAGRVVVAWRRGGRARGKGYAEPYAALSIMDPDTSIRSDVAWEASGGVNVGIWDQLKLTLEAQRRSFARNVPESLGIFMFGHNPMPPATSTTLVIQVGGRF